MDYEDLVETLCAKLSSANHEIAVQLASLAFVTPRIRSEKSFMPE